jgi:hypothetical protein
MQAPAAQRAVALAPRGHALPHAPQCIGLSSMRCSQPSSAAPLQSPQPALQLATRHTRDAQVPIALGGAHGTPQALQFVVVSRGASHPSEITRLQSPRPSLHVNVHAPPTHAGVEEGGVAHAVPQAPQWSALSPVDTHAPLQSAVPAGHVDTHAPRLHAVFIAHARPQAPQWASVLRFTSQPSASAPLQLP